MRLPVYIRKIAFTIRTCIDVRGQLKNRYNPGTEFNGQTSFPEIKKSREQLIKAIHGTICLVQVTGLEPT